MFSHLFEIDSCFLVNKNILCSYILADMSYLHGLQQSACDPHILDLHLLLAQHVFHMRKLMSFIKLQNKLLKKTSLQDHVSVEVLAG